MTPTRLLMPTLDGLRTDLTEVPTTPGLRVLIGKNNAGKSRVMRALAGAELVAEVKLSQLDFSNPQHQSLSRLATNAAMLRVRFSREGHLHAFGRPPAVLTENAAAGPVEFGEDVRQIVWSLAGSRPSRGGVPPREADSAFWAGLAALIQAQLRPRPSCLIPTHRHFPTRADYSQSPDVAQIAQWATVLAGLGDHPDRRLRSQGEEVFANFTRVTDGLEVRFRGTGPHREVFVVEAGTDGLPLAQCGDGLRDLLALLMLVAMHPEAELFVEEPGIRLHPGAQRRVLHVLEDAAKTRPVWITTHDGVFAGARSAVARYSVRRNPDRTSVLVEMANAAELREANVDLGWQPGDAFLADRVLYCEGASDKLMFEALIADLATEDASLGGALVVELGGCSVVWGRDRRTLLRNLNLLRRVAPHAQQVILLDGDGKPQSEMSALADAVQASARIPVCWLDGAELEASFLAPAFVRRLLHEHAAEADLTLDAAAVDAAIERHLPLAPGLTPSKGLEALHREMQLNYSKPRGAQVAAVHLRTDAPEEYASLRRQVRAALDRASAT
ncbi:MAG: AAA family ATPase [Deltaproteobacteria bacterium]|nr:AAA family ATPase [Deltaproteobacteria bacterium]